jgi:polyhydroxyalkanoate synthesis regulator phasin
MDFNFSESENILQNILKRQFSSRDEAAKKYYVQISEKIQLIKSSLIFKQQKIEELAMEIGCINSELMSLEKEKIDLEKDLKISKIIV